MEKNQTLLPPRSIAVLLCLVGLLIAVFFWTQHRTVRNEGSNQNHGIARMEKEHEGASSQQTHSDTAIISGSGRRNSIGVSCPYPTCDTNDMLILNEQYATLEPRLRASIILSIERIDEHPEIGPAILKDWEYYQTTLRELGRESEYLSFLAGMPNSYRMKPELLSAYAASLDQDGRSIEAEEILKQSLQWFPQSEELLETYATWLSFQGENRAREADFYSHRRSHTDFQFQQ